jgi:hypothetical protein
MCIQMRVMLSNEDGPIPLQLPATNPGRDQSASGSQHQNKASALITTMELVTASLA